MDLLLNVDVIVDLCNAQRPGHAQAMAAVQRCQTDGARVWLYSGALAPMLAAVAADFGRTHPEAPPGDCQSAAQLALKECAIGKHWLSALVDETDLSGDMEPLDEQLLLALKRLAPARLLSADARLLEAGFPTVLTPAAYLDRANVDQKIDFIDLRTQQDAIRPALERRIAQVLHHGQYIMGPEVLEMEQKLAAYTGARHCISVASGTEALLIAMMAIGIKAGDEVITTPFSFIATAETIVLLGAKPVFVDIDPLTCNLDPSLIEARITDRTRAIMPVSLYGQPADMDEINAIAAKHNLVVIEDAAQSFGASYHGKKSCNLSSIGCTSFFPSKPLGCYGDGGALFTSDDALAQAMREIRVHGQSRRYVHTRIGVGGRMDTLQCAIILAKMDRFEWEVQRRMEIGARYATLLEGRLSLVAQKPDRTNVFAQYTVFVDQREAVQAQLQQQGIPTAVHYPVPMHVQPAYVELCERRAMPAAESAAARVMSIPMSADLSDQTIAFIANALIRAARG